MWATKVHRRLGTMMLRMTCVISFYYGRRIPNRHHVGRWWGTQIRITWGQRSGDSLGYHQDVGLKLCVSVSPTTGQRGASRVGASCLVRTTRKRQHEKCNTRTCQWPVNTNRSLQSHVTSTGNRYQLSMQPFQITKHNLQRMNARPYPQKKDVDSIALNASLHPLEAPTKRSATKTSWMTFAMIMRLQKLLRVKASACKSFCV